MLISFLQVRLRLTGIHTGWSGALRFGFTSLDPSELVASDIPKYACPDLVTRPGYWAKALPERMALKDNILSFWADRHGRVFYSINDGDPILFHCGLSIGCPLWAIIDIYGSTQEVTLLGKNFIILFICPVKVLSLEQRIIVFCSYYWPRLFKVMQTVANHWSKGSTFKYTPVIKSWVMDIFSCWIYFH